MSLGLKKLNYTFAIEDMLGASARVVQEKVFSTKHLGRVFDFVLFEADNFFGSSKSASFLEYRIRQMLEQMIFCGWSNYRSDEKVKCVELDCGWDNRRFIMAVSFLIDTDINDFDPAQEHTKPKARIIKKMLSQLQTLSDGVVVRIQREYARIQIFCFVDLEEKDENFNALHFLDKPQSETDTPENQQHEDTMVAATNLTEAKLEEFTASEKKSVQESKQKAITGYKKVGNNELPAARAPQDLNETETAKKAEMSFDEVKNKILESAAGDKLDGTVSDKTKFDEHGDAEGSVELLLDTLKADIMPLCVGLSKEQFDVAFADLSQKIQENYSQTLRHMVKLKTIQLVNKASQYKDQMKLLQDKIENMKAEREEIIARMAKSDRAAAEMYKLKSEAEASLVARDKLQRIEAEATKASKALEEKAEKINMGPEGKQWSREYIQSVEKERTILQHRLHETETELKKAKIEISAKENTFKEAQRIADEKVKQHEFIVKKAKESLAQSVQQLERTKATKSADGKVTTAEELQGKLIVTEKLLAGAKDNIDRMQKRVDEVQKKWQDEFSTRTTLQKNLSDSEKKAKLADDFRGKNQELSLKVNALTTQLDEANKKLAKLTHESDLASGTGGSDADVRLKYDRLQKLNQGTREDLIKIKKKYDDLRQEEMRLKNEVIRLQGELKTALKAAPPKVAAPAKPAATPAKPTVSTAKPSVAKSPLISPKKK